MADTSTAEALKQAKARIMALEAALKACQSPSQTVLRDLQRLEMHAINTPLAVIEWDRNFQLVRWSGQAEHLFGWTAGELLGKHPDEWPFIHPEDEDGVHRIMEELLLANCSRNTYANRNLTKHGQVRHCEWYNSVLFDSEGRLDSILSFVHDITERRQMEHREHVLLSVFETTSDAICTLKRDLQITDLNPAARRMLGINKESTPESWSLIQFLPEWSYSQLLKEALPAATQKGSWQGEGALLNNQGMEIPVSLVIIAHPQINHHEPLLSIVFRDLSTQKQAQASILRAKDMAEESERAKSDFLAVMSHEVRTPLNAIQGFSELLMGTKLDDEQQDYVSIINNSSANMLEIINDILDYSRIEAGRMELLNHPFSLSECIDEIRRTMAVQVKKKKLSLDIDVDEQVPRVVYGDESKLRQILVNLINNAIKFTRQGTITVKVALLPEQPLDDHPELRLFWFSVQDTGIGIHPDQTEALFKPFSQVNPSQTRKQGGTGLGLAICRRLCQLMGGDITVQSQPGKGSDFQFTVAMLDGSQSIDKAEFPSPKTILDPLAPKHPLTVLLADDITEHRLLLSAMLRTLGYTPDMACHGRGVVQAMEKKDYQVVLLDLHLPDIDGFQVIDTVRNKNRQIKTYAIALSADLVSYNRQHCIKRGFNDFLAKPIHLNQLRQALQACPRA